MKRTTALIVSLLALLLPGVASAQNRAIFQTLPGLPVYDIRASGAVPTDATKTLDAINAAGLAASATGGVVLIPPGTNLVDPSGASRYIRLRSNVVYCGAAGRSTLKVKDNAGNYQALFWDAGSTLTKWAIRDLTIDQNPAGNTTADIRTFDGLTVLNNNQCQFGVYVQGVNSSDIEVSGCTFDKCDGVNTVCINATGISGVKFNDNRFVFQRGNTTGTMPGGGPFNGASGYDASVGYFACKGVQGYRNKVVVPSYADFNGGFEIHGVEQDWQLNKFDGCYTAFSIVPPFTAGDNQTPSNVTVSNNQINRAAVAIGMQLPGLSPNQVNAAGWKIHNNTISLYQGTGHHDSTESAGIRLSDNGATASTLDGLEITENRIEFEPDTRATSTRYGGAALSTTQHGIIVAQRTPVRNVTVRDNKIVRAPATGIQLGFVNASAELTGVTATHNETIDCGANPNNAAVNANNQRAHWDLTGLESDLKVFDNLMKDTAPGASLVGLYGLRLGPMAAPTFSYVDNNRQQTSQLPLLLYVHDFGYNLCGLNFADTLSNGSTIGHQQMPAVRVAPSANRTGILLTAGTYHGQRVTIFNEGDFTITFAATGTFGNAGASNVAGGTSEVIGAQQCRTFVWNGVVNKWYATGGR